MAKKKTTTAGSKASGKDPGKDAINGFTEDQQQPPVDETVQSGTENVTPSEETVQNRDETVAEDASLNESQTGSENGEGGTIEGDPGTGTRMEDNRDRLPYLSEVPWGWHKHNFEHWKKLLYTDKPAMALEIGAFDGVSACTMADHFFPHPDSRIYTIDPFNNGDPSTPQTGPETETLFHENVKRGGHKGKVVLLKGYSEVVLRQIYLEESNETFDFIFIDGAHDAKSVLKDAVLAFDLLKPGGILIFDDFEWTYVKGALNQPKAGILAFESVFGDRLELVFSKWARCYRKK